jgi:hypothetical protein
MAARWAHFRYEKGLKFEVIFNVQNFQVGSNSLLKWAHFRLKKTDGDGDGQAAV